MMEFTGEDLDTLIRWFEYYDVNNIVDDELASRIHSEMAHRKELAEFASDCGDSCKL